MFNWNIDFSKKISKPKLYLCKPDMSIISPLNEVNNLTLTKKLKGINEINFNLPYLLLRNHVQVKNKNVDLIKYKYLIKFIYKDFVSFFTVQSTKESYDGVKYLQIQALSLEDELRRKSVRYLKKDAVTISEVSNEALNDTGWKLNRVPFEYIDIDAPRMSFEINSRSVIDTLNEFADSYRLVIHFDTLKREVNFYKDEEIGLNKGLIISDRKYLQSFLRESDSEQFCTRLYVYGKDNLSINRVSLTGQSYIENFNYFLYPFQRDENRNVIEHSDYMSDSLCHSILDYQLLLESKQGQFDVLFGELETIQSRLTQKNNELFDLENDLKIIEAIIEAEKLYGNDATTYEQDRQAKLVEIDAKKSEINQVKSEETAKNNEITQLQQSISKESNFTNEQLKELNPFIIEDEWTNENYPNDKLLYAAGVEEFEKRSTPPLSLQLSIVNFLSIIKEQNNWDKLSIGDIVRFKKPDMGIDLKAKIIQVNFNFDNEEIDLTVSNVTELMDLKKRIMKKIYKADNAVKYLDQNKDNWNKVGTDLQGYIDQQIGEVEESISNLNKDLNRSLSDGFISKTEANLLKINMEQLKAESIDLIDVAEFLNITVEKDTYETQLTELDVLMSSYIDQPEYPISILLTERNALNSKFESVQTAKTALINKITEVQSQPGKDVEQETRKSIRNPNPISKPSILQDGSSIDHVKNEDGSVDISFEWMFIENEESPITGFGVLVYSSDNPAVHTPSLISDSMYSVGKNSRSFVMTGVTANKYYTFSVFAYRIVDPSINAEGMIKSDIAVSTLTTENPYRPADNISYNGNFLGTIGGIPYDSINKKAETVIVGTIYGADNSSERNKNADVIITDYNAEDVLNGIVNGFGTEGGTIRLLEGKYYLYKPFYIPSNVTIIGSGRSTFLYQMKNPSSSEVGMGSSYGLIQNKTAAEGNRNIAIRDLTIHMRGTAVGDDSMRAIYFDNVEECLISNVSIVDSIHGSIYLANSDRNLIKDCSASGVLRFIHLIGSSDNIVTNNILKDSSGFPNSSNGMIYIDALSFNNTIAVNNIRNGYTGIANRGENTIILNNTIQDCTYYGVSNATDVSLTLTNNTIANSDIGIYFSSGITKMSTISENTIKDSKKNGIQVFSGQPMIKNNTIIGSSLSSSGTYSAIYAVSTNGNISNNTILKNGTTLSKYAIELGASSSGNIVQQNDIRSSYSVGSISDSGSGNVIQNNIV